MKKSISIFMMIVLILGVLSACGPKREDASTKDNGKKDETAAKPEKLVNQPPKESADSFHYSRIRAAI